MTRAGILMREICECLGVDVQASDVCMVLVERDQQRWHVEVTPGDQRLIIYSDLNKRGVTEATSEYYLRMNTKLEFMRGAWIGVDVDDAPKLYYQESSVDLTALGVVSILHRLIGLHRHLVEART